MEKYNQLLYSPAALNDLNGILNYINDELKNQFAALNTINSILDSIERLKTFSQIGKPISTITGIESYYRFLVCGSYLVFYRVKNNSVYIDRILFGKCDYMRILFEDDTDKI